MNDGDEKLLTHASSSVDCSLSLANLSILSRQGASSRVQKRKSCLSGKKQGMNEVFQSHWLVRVIILPEIRYLEVGMQ